MTKKQPQQSYRELRAKLDQVLDQMEDPSLDIDRAIELYNEGMQLTQAIEKYLSAADNEIRQVSAKYKVKNS